MKNKILGFLLISASLDAARYYDDGYDPYEQRRFGNYSRRENDRFNRPYDDSDLRTLDDKTQRFITVLKNCLTYFPNDEAIALMQIIRQKTNDYFLYKILFNAGTDSAHYMKDQFFPGGNIPQKGMIPSISKDFYADLINRYARGIDLKDERQAKSLLALKVAVKKNFTDEKWAEINAELSPLIQDQDAKKLFALKDNDPDKPVIQAVNAFIKANQYDQIAALIKLMKNKYNDFFIYKILFNCDGDAPKKLIKELFENKLPKSDNSVRMDLSFFIDLITAYGQSLDLTQDANVKVFSSFKDAVKAAVGDNNYKTIYAKLDKAYRNKKTDAVFGDAFNSDSSSLKALSDLVKDPDVQPARIKAQFILDAIDAFFQNNAQGTAGNLFSSLTQQPQNNQGSTSGLSDMFKNLGQQYQSILTSAQLNGSIIQDISTALKDSIIVDSPQITAILYNSFISQISQNAQLSGQVQTGYRVPIDQAVSAFQQAMSQKQTVTFDSNILYLMSIQSIASVESTPGLSLDDLKSQIMAKLNDLAVKLNQQGNITAVNKSLFDGVMQNAVSVNSAIPFGLTLYNIAGKLGFTDQEKTAVYKQINDALTKRSITFQMVQDYQTKRQQTQQILPSLTKIDPGKTLMPFTVNQQQAQDANNPQAQANPIEGAIDKGVQNILQNQLGKLTQMFGASG